MNKKNKTLLIALSIILTIALCVTIPLITINKHNSVKKVKVIKEKEEKVEVTVIKEEPQKALLSLEEIAQEVIDGKWGSGEEREQKLTQAGYNYEEVQNKVNELVPSTPTQTSTYNPSTEVSIPEGEFAVARLIWNTMRSWGWSPETCAGIIGNMMAEVGGGTLNLNWNASGYCGYGLIQWTSGRYNSLVSIYGYSPSIEQQLSFMRDELYGTNGVRQQVGADALNLIMYSGSPESVALAFAAYYERCGERYRYIRQDYARTAYQYFMN